MTLRMSRVRAYINNPGTCDRHPLRWHCVFLGHHIRSLVASDEAVAYFDERHTLIPVAAGIVTITASYGGLSVSKNITISTETASISSMAIGSSPGTLSGYVNTTDELTITADFDDGTTLTIATTAAASSSWLQPSQLIGWDSAERSVIAVDAEGVLSLKTNYYSTIGITAYDTCGMGSRLEPASTPASWQTPATLTWPPPRRTLRRR